MRKPSASVRPSARRIAGELPRKGGILEALRRSPLVGADAIAPRPFEPGREAEL